MTTELSPDSLEPGVSRLLARHRAASLREVSYDVRLAVPADSTGAIDGYVAIRFVIERQMAIVADFAADPANLRTVRVNGRNLDAGVTNEHVVIPCPATRPGANEVIFEFVAGAPPLNRQPDFLYSLFVPARAREVFPCFDQPDLKARFTLTLSVPAAWQAVANTPIESEQAIGGHRVVRFRPTEPLPTYLFSFAAGVLSVEYGERDGRTFRVWHRQAEPALLQRNLGEIVDLHARALAWLEAYTGIAYPFAKFDIVLVPSFQFSGMEHPGAILYNAQRLLLESSASEHDHLTRTSLIAHETAHMWFGDLVTMRWFDDVWLKEVFANFIADKVVAEVFPRMDHPLRFFHTHYPAAYAVDRSEGSNPIRQPLDNLASAGQLYGPIIYLKAPVVFRQLEMNLGEAAFRDGVQRYLRAFSFANADWDDLRTHLVGEQGAEIDEWSRAWIDEAGRPRVTVEPSIDAGGQLRRLTIRNVDPSGRSRAWPQQIALAIGRGAHVERMDVALAGASMDVRADGGRPDFVLAGGGGLGYGHFPLDENSRAWLLRRSPTITDALTRGVAWAALWDELLEGAVPAVDWVDAAIAALDSETDDLNIDRLLTMLSKAFWLFLSSPEREAVAARVETCLRHGFTRAATPATRSAWFAAYRQLTMTPDGCARLERLWRREENLEGLSLGEADATALTMEIALRAPDRAHELIALQAARVTDRDLLGRLRFAAPAVSPDSAERERGFERLYSSDARRREPWVLSFLQYLSHPLHQADARRFIRPGLEMLPDLQRTGDIFFPARWCEALLGGHSSPAAGLAVREYLRSHEELAPPLRRTVLVAADLLFRASRT